MELAEILTLEGIKLLDTNVFIAKNTLLEQLYDCKTSSDFPIDSLLAERAYIQECFEYLSLKNIFTIEEVVKELDCQLSILNEQLRYHSSNKRPYFKKNIRHLSNADDLGYKTREQIIKKRKRRSNRYAEKRKKHLTDSSLENGISEDNITCLNQLCQDAFRLTKTIRENNILAASSLSERNIYNNFFQYFMYACEKHSLLKDNYDRSEFLKSSKPCNFQTDQKLTSLAFTLAAKSPVIIISSDKHIKRLIEFFNKGKEDKILFNIQNPPYNITLYSDFLRDSKTFEFNIAYLSSEN